MAIQFRPTVQADYPQICQLFPSPEEMYLIYPSGTFPMTTEQLQAIAQERIDLTSVAIDDRIVGFSNLYNYMPDQYAFIGNVVIHPEQRGQGMGKALIAYMLDRCFTIHDLPEVRITVLNYNSRALLLYSSLDFTPYSIEEIAGLTGERVAFIHLSKNNPAIAGKSYASISSN
ncbi:MAG: GNAT family protein [Cyanobacteria bacterium P01_A01_bin.3]